MSDLYQSLLDMQAAHSKAQQQLTAERAHSERLAEALRGAVEEIRFLDGKDNSCNPKGDLSQYTESLAAHEERKKV